jgi:SAM-dependent methyltransferase
MAPARSPTFGAPPRVRGYDLGAWFYDLLVGSRLYHRTVWGMPPDEHLAFARRALELSSAGPDGPDGPILDAGCGSLLFTAPCYRGSMRDLTLLDASATMLARAARRLGPPAGPTRFMRADLRTLPFEPARFAAVFHFGVLHCLDERARVLSELARVVRPGGRLFLSCLTLGRPRGDAFLRRLARAGQVATPFEAQHVLETTERAGWKLLERRQRGSFLFLEAQRADRAS